MHSANILQITFIGAVVHDDKICSLIFQRFSISQPRMMVDRLRYFEMIIRQNPLQTFTNNGIPRQQRNTN